MSTLRINLWSGPRNVSTALMYSFAQRSDTRVVDEPLYGHYLSMTDVEHPAAEQVLAATERDAATVIRDTILGPCDRPVLFLKQMAHHLTTAIDRSFLARTTNVLLIRDPGEVLRTLVNQVRKPVLRDVGIAMQAELLTELENLGQRPPVLDSRELLLDPRGVLDKLCQQLGIEFDEAMLSWQAGPRPEDGVWAPHWYHNVHKSTGFGPYRPKTDPLPAGLEPLLEQCQPHYDVLLSRAIRASHP